MDISFGAKSLNNYANVVRTMHNTVWKWLWEKMDSLRTDGTRVLRAICYGLPKTFFDCQNLWDVKYAFLFFVCGAFWSLGGAALFPWRSPWLFLRVGSRANRATAETRGPNKPGVEGRPSARRRGARSVLPRLRIIRRLFLCLFF